LCCAFGIDFYFKDGSVMELVNPQSVSFSWEKIFEAQDKVGYAPTTQNLLKSEKPHHKAVLDENGNPILEMDPLGALMLGIERDNQEVIRCIIASHHLFHLIYPHLIWLLFIGCYWRKM
jgi:hypothetical protein